MVHHVDILLIDVETGKELEIGWGSLGLQVGGRWRWSSEHPLWKRDMEHIGRVEVLGGWMTIRRVTREVAACLQRKGYDGLDNNCHHFAEKSANALGLNGVKVSRLASMFPSAGSTLRQATRMVYKAAQTMVSTGAVVTATPSLASTPSSLRPSLRSDPPSRPPSPSQSSRR